MIKAATATSFPTQTRAGAQLEAYCSGLGKVLLAALPPEQLDAIILDGELVALTPETITDKRVLRQHLDEVRAQGYATDIREFRPDMCCVAVPVCDEQGHAVAAISITVSAGEMTPARQDELRAELAVAAAAIGRKACPSGPGLRAELAHQRLGEAA